MAHLNTRLAQAGCGPDAATGGLVLPIELSTTYERGADGSYPKGFAYGRDANPTRGRLEQALADIEGGFGCAAFSSGMAASHAVLLALPHDAHVIIPDDVYYVLRRLVLTEFEPRGMKVSVVDMTSPERVAQALTKETRLIWAETPSNPLLKISDLEKIGSLAASAGAFFVVDGTWATPVLQRPFDYGADLVVHSLTKCISGHSDVLGGAVVAREETDFFARIRTLQRIAGAVLDPFSCWLTLRGLRTLGVRMARQSETARQVAAFLAPDERVTRVFYPGLSMHPGHEIAARQMSDFGGVISFEIAGGAERAMAVAAAVRVFTRATSLGGTESLIEHRASIEGPESLTPPSLLRLSIGLEHADDLMEDLDHALGRG